ncbi:uncharacterized protein J8A68_005532 [[Candida] subhashii]|uniref:Uncharacterized protein n=1 Tax=[Candida] subhashii TaxID=561895 RepID=A0A8J5QGS2_9ASCO|nr:uncharacterized protein J8A68_005532 [[Candida] subhashii]KAG7661012.1 hypothetical protein J8A68_005532 [[Candida] subhashii]
MFSLLWWLIKTVLYLILFTLRLIKRIIYLIIIILIIIGPILWYSITRAYSDSFKTSFPIIIPVGIQFGNEQFNFPDLVEATQLQVTQELRYLTDKHVKVKLYDYLSPVAEVKTPYTIELVLSDQTHMGMNEDGKRAYVFYTLDSIYSNDLPFLITQTILYHLLKPQIEIINKSDPLTVFPTVLDKHLLEEEGFSGFAIQLILWFEGLARRDQQLNQNRTRDSSVGVAISKKLQATTIRVR